jgi:hypothetical protein
MDNYANIHRQDADIARDDLQLIESIERDLRDMCGRITRNVVNGTLRSLDQSLLGTRIRAMEMTLDEILGPDKERAQAAVSEAA